MSVRQLESKDEFVALKAEVVDFLARREASFLIYFIAFRTKTEGELNCCYSARELIMKF